MRPPAKAGIANPPRLTAKQKGALATKRAQLGVSDDEIRRRTVEGAEQRIQRILLDLDGFFGLKIEHVEVDMRNFRNMKTEIHFALTGAKST